MVDKPKRGRPRLERPATGPGIKLNLDAIRRKLAGETYRDLAAEYGVSTQALFRYVKRWRHLVEEGEAGTD